MVMLDTVIVFYVIGLKKLHCLEKGKEMTDKITYYRPTEFMYKVGESSNNSIAMIGRFVTEYDYAKPVRENIKLQLSESENIKRIIELENSLKERLSFVQSMQETLGYAVRNGFHEYIDRHTVQNWIDELLKSSERSKKQN